MLIKQYAHRLPADYDMQIIRKRAAALGPEWNDAPGLGFKAFALRESGQHGAPGNVYASIYLWLKTAAAVSFLTGDRFQKVVGSFGRPRIEAWLALDVQLGGAHDASWLLREDADVPDDAGLAEILAAEIAGNGEISRREGSVAVFTGLDVASWRLSRFTLSAVPPRNDGIIYEVLHLAAPGRHALAQHLRIQEPTLCR